MPGTIKCELYSRIGHFGFTISPEDTGKQVFDKVMFCLGIREVWYFGLCCTAKSGESTWLSPHTKVLEQRIKKKEPIKLLLTFKFYPEDVEDIIQPITKRMLYLQIKEYIYSSRIFCPPETAFLLASYAVQARYGNHEIDLHKAEQIAKLKLIPQSVLAQFRLTKIEAAEKILQLHVARKKVSREEAYGTYLQIAQDLDMFSVRYFPVRNARGVGMMLGVDPSGLKFYSNDNVLAPKIAFHMGELEKVSFDTNKITVKMNDTLNAELLLFVSDTSIARRIFLRILGYHDIYKRRRNPDVELMSAIAEEAAKQRAKPPFINDSESRTEKEAIKDEHQFDMEVKKKFKEHDGLIKEAVKELVECQSEIRKLELKASDADRKIRKLEDKHYSSIRYRQIYEREMRMNRASIPVLLGQQRELQKKTQRYDHDTAKRAAETARLRSMINEARILESELKTDLSALDSPEEMWVATEGISENDKSQLAEAQLGSDKVPVEAPWHHRELFCELDFQTSQEVENLQADLTVYRDINRITDIDSVHLRNKEKGFRKYAAVRGILRSTAVDRVRMFDRSDRA